MLFNILDLWTVFLQLIFLTEGGKKTHRLIECIRNYKEWKNMEKQNDNFFKYGGVSTSWNVCSATVVCGLNLLAGKCARLQEPENIQSSCSFFFSNNNTTTSLPLLIIVTSHHLPWIFLSLYFIAALFQLLKDPSCFLMFISYKFSVNQSQDYFDQQFKAL